MIKIWAKTLVKDKITQDIVYEINTDKMVWSLLFNVLCEICGNMDIPTPVLLKSHTLNFAKYNFVQFVKSDFVESVNFDKLHLEFLKE